MAWHEGEKFTEVVDGSIDAEHPNGITLTVQMADRFLCDDCEAGKHGEITSLIGLCGCQCHDGADGSL